MEYRNKSTILVPVREDGVDLSSIAADFPEMRERPRPRGRGGFKRQSIFREVFSCVPVREDGVDLSMSEYDMTITTEWSPSARTGWI